MRQVFYIAFVTLLTFFNNLKAQDTKSIRNAVEICDKIEIIDSIEFCANRQAYQIIDTTSVLEKNNGVINVQSKDTTFTYKDNTSDEDFFEYRCAGLDTIKKEVLILGQDYNRDYYYLINQNTNKIDTLVGYPRIFGDKFLCEEGSYTDGTAYIEIWNINNDKPYLIERFSLIPCDIYGVDESYLKNDYLYVKYDIEKYIRVKILK